MCIECAFTLAHVPMLPPCQTHAICSFPPTPTPTPTSTVPLKGLVPGQQYTSPLALHTITGREPRETGKLVPGAVLHTE